VVDRVNQPHVQPAQVPEPYHEQSHGEAVRREENVSCGNGWKRTAGVGNGCFTRADMRHVLCRACRQVRVRVGNAWEGIAVHEARALAATVVRWREVGRTAVTRPQVGRVG